MTKTNKTVSLYKPSWGWNFTRRVYTDSDGTEYVMMHGWTKLEWAMDAADKWQVHRD